MLVLQFFLENKQTVCELKQKLKVCFQHAHELRLTKASTFVRAQLHEVRTSAGERLVVVDEAEVRAGLFAIFSCTRVRSYREANEEKELIQCISINISWNIVFVLLHASVSCSWTDGEFVISHPVAVWMGGRSAGQKVGCWFSGPQ